MAAEYCVAALLVAAALATTLGLWEPVFSRNPFAPFYAAVIVAAWFGGIGPGLAATGLAIAAIDVFLLPSFVSPLRGWQDLVQVGTFVFITVLVSSLDATRRRAMDALRAAKESAEMASGAKDQFLAVLSHELRTPLTPALVAASTLEADPSLAAGVRGELGMIRRNIELEARLIDDLLDLSRIVRGKLPLKPETLDVRAVLEDVAGICRGAAEMRGIRLSVDSGASAAWVCADGARFRQVLWNLLNNGVKFTPAGGEVRVCLRLEGCAEPGTAAATATANGADLGLVRIDVEDTGAGIAADVLPRIFNAFEQGGSCVTRHFGGLGLGLAIARAIVTQHGGSINVASDGPGTGARFTVRLPRVAAPASAATVGQSPGPAPARATLEAPAAVRRLLLVEDHPDTSRALAHVLRHHGYEVKTAATCSAARAAVAGGGRFDLLLSDLGLPDGTGLDLVREIGSQFPRGAIALSGYGMEHDVANSRAVGFAAHLTKPVDVDQLARTLDAAFGG
jgi:signal transduction histidine kinase